MKRFFAAFNFSRREAMRLAIPVLALVLVASVVTGREKPSSAPVEPVRKVSSKVEVSDADLDLELLKRPQREEGKVGTAGDPFARNSFAPPQAVQQAAQAAPPQPPQAPDLPFKYLGKVIEDGKLSVFLARGDDSFSLQAGKKQKLDEQYRVDKVTESSVTFTYLPMNARQTLDIPAVNQ
jgi:hypothetical protein